MANQWGRDGGQSVGAPRGGGVALPVLVALVLGVAGGYGGFRYLSGGSTTELQASIQRISELEKTISDLRFADSSADQQTDDLQVTIDGLNRDLADAREQIETLEKANKSLSSENGDGDSAELENARREIEALKKTLDEAGDLRAELAKAHEAQRKVVDLQSQLLLQGWTITSLKNQLSERAANADEAAATRIKALTAENAALTGEIATQRRQSAAAIKSTEAKLENISERAGALEAQLAKSRTDLAGLAGGLSAGEKDRQALAQQVKTLKNRNEGLIGELVSLEKQYAAVQSMNAALKRQVADLTSELTALKDAADANPPNEPDLHADDPDQPDTPTEQKRDPAFVETALARMPGIARLSAPKQEVLRTKLENGECVTDALGAVYERVPVISLRNLIRDLKSPC